MQKYLMIGLGLTLCAQVAVAKPKAAATSDTKAASHVTMGERKWVNDVMATGNEEISLGKLAASKGSSAKVKEMGQHMVSAHTALNRELKGLADKKGIKIDAKSSDKNYKKLAKLTGKQFDKEYARMMVDGHTDTEKAFKSEADKGNDPNLQAWAGKSLTVIQGHLKMAKSVQSAVGK